MVRSTNYYDDLKESFQKNPSEAATYLEVVIEEGDSHKLRIALRNVLEAYGGVNNLSPTAKSHYQKLDLALSNTGFPELYSLVNLLDEIGFQLAVNIKNNSVA